MRNSRELTAEQVNEALFGYVAYLEKLPNDNFKYTYKIKTNNEGHTVVVYWEKNDG